MSILSATPMRLESLRRSKWLSGFVLIVCLMRVGMAIACTPHDLVELASQGEGSGVEMHLASDDDDSDAAGGDTSGHCLHCACHYAVALPATLAGPAGEAADPAVSLPASAQANAPPSHELRPPIG